MSPFFLRLTGSVVAVLVLVAGCAYRGADDPVSLRLSWFSYLNGDDLRGLCIPGAPDRYRFVYNGVNVEQLRLYELTERPGGDGHILSVRVIGAPSLATVEIGAPGDLIEPWRGRSETVVLRDDDLALLRRAMESARVFDPSPEGLELPSKGFFWIVDACRAGRFHFNAYLWPSDRFDRAAFANLLLAWDPTGVALNAPRVPQYELYDPDQATSARNFQLRVGRNGLWGAKPWF